MAFEIDGSPVKDPISFAYEEVFTPHDDSHGFHVPSAYRASVATFNVMTPAQFEDWVTAYDGQPHTIKFYAPNSNSLTDYSNVYIENLNTEISTGLYYYNASFRVWHISPAGLSAFGETDVFNQDDDDVGNNLLFTHPHALLGMGLANHVPSVVWTGAITSTPVFPSDGTGVGTLDVSTSAGAYTAVREGMVVMIRAGGSDYYTNARTPPTSSELYIDGLGDGTLLGWGSPTFTVYDTYIPYTRRIRLISNVEYINFDLAYTDENENFGPQAIFGSTAIKNVDGSVDFEYDASDSIAWTPGSTIVDYLFEWPDGSSTSGASPTATFTTSTPYPNGAWSHCTVTDSNGDTHTGHRRLFKFDSLNPPILNFSVESFSGSWGDGATAEIKISDVALQSTGFTSPLGYVVLFGDTAYGSTEANVLIDCAPQRQNVWIEGFVLNTDVEMTGGSINYTYQIGTIDKLLDTLDAFPIMMDESVTPTSWLEMFPNSINNNAFHLCRWRSTIIDITDVYMTNLDHTVRSMKYFDASAGTLWAQMKQTYARMIGGTVSCDAHGRIFFEQDVMISDEGTDAHLAVIAGGNQTLLQPYVFGFAPPAYVRPNSQVVNYGVAWDGSTATPIGSRSPDDPIAHGSSKEIINAGIFATQSEIDRWTGNRRAQLNNTQRTRTYTTWGITRIDCTPQHSFELGYQGEAQIPVLLHVIRSYSWEFDQENGMAWCTYELERYTGTVGSRDNKSPNGIEIDFYSF